MSSKLAIGTALALALRTWARHVPAFLGLSLVAHLPLVYAARQLVDGHWLVDRPDLQAPTLLLLSAVGYTLVTGLVARAVDEGLRRVSSPPPSQARRLLRQLPALLVTLLVMFFFAGLWSAAGGFLVRILGALVPGDLRVTVVGTLHFLVLTAIFLRYYAVVPAAMVEELEPKDSLERSIELTAGQRWRILLAVLPVYGLDLVVMRALNHNVDRLGADLWWASFSLASVVLASFGATLTVVVYRELHMLRHGPDLEDYSRVFE